MMLLSAFGIALVSALCPLVNLEISLAGLAAFSHTPGFWPLCFVAAAGQSMGKLAWYQVGRSSMNWKFIQNKMQSPRWQQQYDRIRGLADRRWWAGTALIFGSATVGLPPLAIMAVITGQLQLSRVLFYCVTFVGRTLRFATLMGGVSWLAHLV